MNFPSVKNIPHKLRSRVTLEFANLMDEASKDSDSTACISAWVQLLLFIPATLRVLASNDPAYKCQTTIRKRAEMRQHVKFLDRWQDSAKSRNDLIKDLLSVEGVQLTRSTDANQVEASNLKRCIRLMREEGQYGKAAKSLCASGVAPANQDTLHQLKLLHPVSSLPTPTSTDGIRSFQISVDNIGIALRSFPKGTGGGRSGLRVGHLLSMFSVDLPGFGQRLATLLQILADGKAPGELAPFIASAPLTPLLKKDLTIRPIAVGEVLRRIVSKIALAAVLDKAVDKLKSSQVGIGVPNAIESILLGLNAIFSSDIEGYATKKGALLVDFSNAFNRVNRQAFFEDVAQDFPEILAWVQYTYGCAAYLFVGEDWISSTTGVQQGDPLGPLLFCVVLHRLLTKLTKITSDQPNDLLVKIVAFLDDVTIIASPDQARTALRLIKEEGPALGLYISLTKSVYWSPSADGVEWDPSDSCPASFSPGIELLGGCIATTQTYAGAVAMKRVQKFSSAVTTMLKIKDPQLCLLLLRSCVGMPKLNYCWRVNSPSALCAAAGQADIVIVDALANIICNGLKSPGNFALQLASLPVALSGLGVSLPSDVLKFAHLAATIDTMGLRKTLFPSILSNHSSLELISEAFIQQLSSEVRSDPILGVLRRDPMCLGPHSQKVLARLFYSSKRMLLLSSVALTNQHKYQLMATNKLDCAIFDGKSLASQWLFALPNPSMGQTMSAEIYRTALQFRLLMPLFPMSCPCPANKCKQTRDIYGHHLLSCKGDGNTHTIRHNNVAKALCNLANATGVTAHFNPKLQLYGTDNHGRPHAFKPADILFSNLSTTAVCCDMTIVSPLTEAKKDTLECFRPGLSTVKAVHIKNSKFYDVCSLHGYNFCAFAMDVTGITHPTAIMLLGQLASAYARHNDYTSGHAFMIVTRRVSFALQHEVARQLYAGISPF